MAIITTRILDLKSNNALCIAHFDSKSKILIRTSKEMHHPPSTSTSDSYGINSTDGKPLNPIQEYLQYEGIPSINQEEYIKDICPGEKGMEIGVAKPNEMEIKDIFN